MNSIQPFWRSTRARIEIRGFQPGRRALSVGGRRAARAPGTSVTAPHASCRAEGRRGSAARTGTRSRVSGS